MKRLLALTTALLFCAGAVLAEDKKTETPKKPEVKKADEKKKKKAAAVTGKVKSVDAEKGVIVLTVGKKDAMKDQEIKIGDDVKFTLIVSETEKKEGLAAKEGLKLEQLKAGAVVKVMMDGDKAIAVTVGQAKKKKDK